MTGDWGLLDTDSYLFIKGRCRELINKGGEKIAPREIDEAIERIPGVVEAAAFSIPHPTLLEDIAAAVVAPSSTVDDAYIRSRLLETLAIDRIPTTIVRVPALPKGPTGKVLRGELRTVYEEHLRLTRLVGDRPYQCQSWASRLFGVLC